MTDTLGVFVFILWTNWGQLKFLYFCSFDTSSCESTAIFQRRLLEKSLNLSVVLWELRQQRSAYQGGRRTVQRKKYLADTERHESKMAWEGPHIFFTKTANSNFHCELFYGIIIAKNRLKWHGRENVPFLVFLHTTFLTRNKIILKYRELKKL